MPSFTLPAFVCVAVLSCMALVSHGAVLGLCRGACPVGWVNHKDGCFLYVADEKTWIDAELNCLHLGGNLASEHSEDDHQFLKDLHKSLDPTDSAFWIGLARVHKGRKWLWSDGTSAVNEGDFSKWNPGEPNDVFFSENCVHSNFGGQKDWNDVSCDAKFPSICVLRPEPKRLPSCHVHQEIQVIQPPSNQPYV